MEFLSKLRRFYSSNEIGFLRFLIVGATGLVVNNLCLVIFVEFRDLNYLLAAGLATQFSTLWNFVLIEIWVFRQRDPGTSPWGRLARFFLMNNVALLLRSPLLTLMVSILGVHYLPANLISLFVLTVIRYMLSSKWIWIPSREVNGLSVYPYDIHGIIAIESEVRLPELEYFMVPELPRPPDIRLRGERRKHSRTSDQAIRYDDGLGKYGFELSIAPGECTEVQVSHLVKRSPHVLYTNVFEPLLRWTFVRKGYALVHAACVDLDGHGILITAKTDTGKTTTILQTLDNWNYAFLSDDMTILGRDGQLLNYPKPLTISAHTMRGLRNAHLRPRERIILQVQSRLHSRTGRKLAFWLTRSGLPAATINAVVQILVPPPKYHIDRLIPAVKILERSRLTQIVEIVRGRENKEVVDIEGMVVSLVQNAEDAYGFPPYPEIRGSLSQWRGEDLHAVEIEIIQQAVNGCRSWRLSSERYDWWKMISAFAEDESDLAPPRKDQLSFNELDTQPVRS